MKRLVPCVFSSSLLLGSACAGAPPAPTAEASEVERAPSQAAHAVEVEELPKSETASGPSPGQQLVVHEWGTFTSRVDAKGNLLTWKQQDRVEPLPNFVLESFTTPAKQAAKGTVRMETPVLYFYASELTKASASVTFPGGFLTEWYPSATHEDTAEHAILTWPSFEIVPGPDPEFPVDGDSHYYAARDTGAAPLKLDGPGGVEHEKMLFYRGVGSFELPLQASRDERAKTISLAPARELAGVVVFHRRGDALGFEIHDPLDGPVELALPKLDDELDELTGQFEALLIAQGLYAAEAKAMINTWRELWFEDGVRVLYMVPPELTEQTLPLTLEPKPDELVRVLVGRLDLV